MWGVHLRQDSSGAVHLVTWDRVSHWNLELDHLARLASQGAIGILPFQPHSTMLWLRLMWVLRTKLRPSCLWTSALSMGSLCSGLPHSLTSTLADLQEDETKNTPKRHHRMPLPPENSTFISEEERPGLYELFRNTMNSRTTPGSGALGSQETQVYHYTLQFHAKR